MRKITAWILAFLFLTSLMPGISLAQDGFATQTIMVYIVGSDLEGDNGLATADIVEMLRSGMDTERVTVLVMTGGSEKWRAPMITVRNLSIFKVEGRNPTLLHQEPTKSMGEADTLSFFLNFAVEHFPADSYGLVLWNHGAGPMVGFGSDHLFGRDNLELLELQQAMQNSPFSGENRLEWLCFDACLMASMEVASILAPHAKYMIASEETLPGQGVDYNFLGEASRGSLRGDEVGKLIIDHTADYYDKRARELNYNQFLVTLSLMDLDRVQPARAQTDELFQSLQHGIELGVYSDIARRRDATKDYGRAGTSFIFDLIDLTDLADNLSVLYPDHTAALKEAIDDMVLYNRTNVPRSSGLSIYFPFGNKEHYERRWGGLYKDFSVAPVYQTFMDAFGNILLADSLAAWQGAQAPVIQQDADTGEYFVQLTEEQVQHYDRSEYYILAHRWGEEYQLAFVSGDVKLDESGRLFPQFDGKILYLKDNLNPEGIVPIIMEVESIDGIAQYKIPSLFGRLENEGYKTITGDLLVTVNKNTGEAQITGAVSDGLSGGQTGKRDFDLNEWTQVYLLTVSSYLTRSDTGEPLTLGDWVSKGDSQIFVLDIGEGLAAAYQPLDMERFNYYTMMSIVDTQGYSYGSELMPISGERFAQAPVPPITRPDVKEFAIEISQPQSLLLYEEDGITFTLLGTELTAADDTDRRAPDTLLLTILAENQTGEDVHAALDWLSVNNKMVPTSLSLELAAGSMTKGSVSIPIAPQQDGNGLVNLGITALSDISLRFEINRFSGAQWKGDTIGYSDIIRLVTDYPVGAGYEATLPPEDKQVVLIDTPDLLIQQWGAAYSDNLYFHLPLKITNRSAQYDLITLNESVINGIMAPMTLSSGSIEPGTELITLASIPLEHSEFGIPDIGQAALYDMFKYMTSLKDLGIEQVQRVQLRFALDVKERRGMVGRFSALELLPPITLQAAGTAGLNQPLDTKGQLLYNHQGVQIVLLDSDPEGRSFYIFNGSPATIHLRSTIGRVKVDGQPYADNYPLYITLSPGASAYPKLFGYVPDIWPSGKEVSFYFDVIDADYNRLLRQSDEITVPLHSK